jgi:hypothetical protein
MGTLFEDSFRYRTKTRIKNIGRSWAGVLHPHLGFSPHDQGGNLFELHRSVQVTVRSQLFSNST